MCVGAVEMSKLYAIVASGGKKGGGRAMQQTALPSVNAEIWVTWSNIFGRFFFSVLVSVSFWFWLSFGFFFSTQTYLK